MKIKVIFTGGTIGSSVGNDGYIAPNEAQPYKLINMYQEIYGTEDVTFFMEEPYRILSENLDSTHVNQLIDTVERALCEADFDGIIITHGTDTLQYGAGILGYVFGTETIPVVLVSSDFPLEDQRANGCINFACAVDFIKNQRGKGVFVSYCNKHETPKIHRATRLMAHQQYLADVCSVNGEIYGSYSDLNIGKSYFKNSLYSFEKSNYKSICELQRAEGIPHLSENGSAILWIRPYVGMVYPEVIDRYKAILLDSYHSGTIGISDDLQNFMEGAKEKKIPVFLTGLSSDESAYETVGMYREMGIEVLPEISNIAAYCKLWLALSLDLDVKVVMHACVAEDC